MSLRYGFFDSEITCYDEEGMPVFVRAESSDFLALFISKIISDSEVLCVVSKTASNYAKSGPHFQRHAIMGDYLETIPRQSQHTITDDL